jgi:serine protease Do
MPRNSFDDSDDIWSVTDDFSASSEHQPLGSSKPGKSLSLNFNLASKPILFVVCGVVVLLIVGSIVMGQFKKGGSQGEVVATPTNSPSTANVAVDLYAQPKLLQSFIDNALASAVTIYCGNYSGSGWAVDLSDDFSSTKDDNYTTEIVTNNHVIEGCERIGVTIVPMGTKSQYSASVYSYDRTNDLAILVTDKYLPPLPTIQPGNEAHVGQWVMAVGSPGAGDTTLDGSITTGTVTNIQEGVIITDTTINPGNSGGPLLNAAGQVIAVVSAKIVDEKIDSIGIARDVKLICDQLDGCSKKRLLR